MDAELYDLLTGVGRAGYVMHYYGVDRDGNPDVLAAVLKRDGYADVVILHGETCAYAFRTPRGGGCDLLDPERVCWDIAARPQRTLTALLDLPAPGETAAPTVLYRPQQGLCLPAGQRRESLRLRKRAGVMLSVSAAIAAVEQGRCDERPGRHRRVEPGRPDPTPRAARLGRDHPCPPPP
jgi:hypothetical protein